MLVLIAFLVGFSAYTTTTPVLDDDFLGGPDTVLTGDAARITMEQTMAATLPPETEVLGFVEGGFQDKFWQIKLRVPNTARQGALNVFIATELEPVQTTFFALPDDDDWWDPGQQSDQASGKGYIPGFHDTLILTAPDQSQPGYSLIYVFAFQV